MIAKSAKSIANESELPMRARPSALLRADWKFIGLVTAIALVLTNVPYIYGYLGAPANLQFMGIIQNAPDSGEYLAWMRESMRGFLISNTLTPEPNAPAFFNLAFWVLGRFSLLTNFGLVETLELFRIISGILCLLAVYYFCAILLPDRLQRRTAFLLIVFGAGFSLYAAILGKFIDAVDFRAQFVAEGITLYSWMSFPLLVFGMALFSLVFAWVLRAYQEQNLWYAVGASVVALILGVSHGYDLIMVYGVLIVWAGVMILRNGATGRWLFGVMLVIGVSVLPALYFVYLTRANPVWRESLGQFVNAGVFSPDPLSLVFLIGIPLFLVLFTFDGFLPLKKYSENELFIKTWFGVNFFLIYLPVEYQIHFINGWQVPVAILATIGCFRYLLPRLQSSDLLTRFAKNDRLAPISMAILVLVVMPSSIYFVGWRVLDMSRHQSPYFLQHDQVDGLKWLQTNATPEQVVLSSNDIGYYIPGLTGARPFLAHWAMTLGFFEKRKQVNLFFNPTITDIERLSLIKRFNIRYIYWSDAERALGAWNPNQAAFLERVWTSPLASIYRIKD